MSMHTLTATHFNVMYPEMILSNFLISPVPDQEVRTPSNHLSLRLLTNTTSALISLSRRHAPRFIVHII